MKQNKSIQTVSLVGLGAIGAAYLAKMSQSLPHENLRVIASGQRGETIRKNGVIVNGKTYHFTVCGPEETASPADLLIFAVKFNQLDQAMEDVRGQVGPDTLILSLLNGITSEDKIGAAFGIDRMLYSVCAGIDAVRTDSGVTYSSLGVISFGDAKNLPGGYSKKVVRVKELLERAGVPCTVPEDMLRTLWWKFMVNVGINQTSAVLRAPYGVFQRAGEARSLMLDAMKEVILLSEKAGVSLKNTDLDDWLKMAGTLSPSGKTSMLQDMEARRQTEVNIFAGTVLALGQQYRVDVPVNRMLYRLIRASEEMFALEQRG